TAVNYIDLINLARRAGNNTGRRFLRCNCYFSLNNIRIFKEKASYKQYYYDTKQKRNTASQYPRGNPVHYFLHLFATKLYLFIFLFLFFHTCSLITKFKLILYQFIIFAS